LICGIFCIYLLRLERLKPTKKMDKKLKALILTCKKWIVAYNNSSEALQKDNFTTLEDYQELIEFYQLNYTPTDKDSAEEKIKELIAHSLKLYAKEKEQVGA
jgi:hypothetical protein